MQLTGIHHLTAISAKPRDNLAFYTGLLGMRLVKKTVNQDDVSAYHLFYADGKANPGTDLTFFDFPAAPEHRGTNSISRTGLRVAGEASLKFWRKRLKEAGGHVGDIVEVDGRLTLPFEDGEGQRLVLGDDGGAGSSSPWERTHTCWPARKWGAEYEAASKSTIGVVVPTVRVTPKATV